jgi:hypothetical protein
VKISRQLSLGELEAKGKSNGDYGVLNTGMELLLS